MQIYSSLSKHFTPRGTEKQILPSMSIPYSFFERTVLKRKSAIRTHILRATRYAIHLRRAKIFIIPELISAYNFWH